MMNVSLRPANTLDREFVAFVTETCTQKDEEITAESWRLETPEDFAPDIHRIVQFNGEEIGYIAIIEEPVALILKALCIIPDYQRRGVGGCLIHQVIENACASQKIIQLTVLRKTLAHHFFERYGFIIAHSTDEGYFMSLSTAVLGRPGAVQSGSDRTNIWPTS